MFNVQATTDRAAIGLSLLCLLHCLITPIALTLVPSMATLPIAGEEVHVWLIFAVLPTSLLALVLGCKKHRDGKVIAWITAGLLMLVLAITVGHDLGEVGEIVMTVMGVICLSLGHIRNYRLCQQDTCCHEEQAD